MKIRTTISRLVILAGLLLSGVFVFSMAGTRVSGTIRDGSGNAVAHAYVEAIPVIPQTSAGTVGNFPNPWVAADSSGAFSLSLAPGRYRIRAKDEVDGYPDPSFWLNRDSKARFPEIAVGDKEITGVEVVLGTQGGILSGHLQDAQTHKSVADAKIRIQDEQNAKAYVEILTDHTGHFRYTVPSKPVLISAIVPGYKVAAVQSGTKVILSPGEHRELELELEHEQE